MKAINVQEILTNDPYLERTQRNHFFIGGKEGQEKIKKLKIGVAGLGGMGSNIAQYLARLGVIELNLADSDTVDVSNINRQVIANFQTVGRSKLGVSIEEIKNIAPESKLKTFSEGITEDNAEEFVKGCDFIIDEIDVFPIEAHIALHRACRKYDIPVYSAYVIGLGIHFYKFHGEGFKFEDFLSVEEGISESERLNKIVKTFISEPPSYLQNENIEAFKEMAQDHGVPIFGPSCLLGHTIVITRVLADFLGAEVLGVKLPETPVMPRFIKVDLMSLTMSVETFKK